MKILHTQVEITKYRANWGNVKYNLRFLVLFLLYTYVNTIEDIVAAAVKFIKNLNLIRFVNRTQTKIFLYFYEKGL